MKFKPWMIIAFVSFQMFFMIVNESERIRVSKDVEELGNMMAANQTRLQKWKEATNAGFYNLKFRFRNHTHRYYDGKISE